MNLDKVYQGGRHSDMNLRILLKIKRPLESNSRNSDATKTRLVVEKAKITINCTKNETSEISMLDKVQKVFFSKINISLDLMCPSFARSNRKIKIIEFLLEFYGFAVHTLRVPSSPQNS